MISFKTKNGIILILIVSFLYLLYFSWKTTTTTTTKTTTNSNSIIHNSQNTSRLTPERRHILSFALAHIRASYSTNRTPEYSTPPLLILYSCKPNQQCGTLAERMMDITTAYYFAMLNPKTDTAFAYDMTFPAQFEWFLEPTPGHMAMRTNQAQFYLDRAELDEFKSIPHVATTPQSNQRILATTSWAAKEWNQTTSDRVGRYGLKHLRWQSDWFFVASRLLFSRPSDWLTEQLGPYSRLMGTVRLGEGMNREDPDNLVSPPPSNSAWFRVGVRVTREEQVEALASHVLQMCGKCHVFVSSVSATLLDRMRQRLANVAVHAVAEGYEFDDLDVPPKSWKLFESNEQLKRQYARIFMDWIILTRMDHLVGIEGDLFIKTAAWTAQVQTDVLKSNGKMVSLVDW